MWIFTTNFWAMTNDLLNQLIFLLSMKYCVMWVGLPPNMYYKSSVPPFVCMSTCLEAEQMDKWDAFLLFSSLCSLLIRIMNQHLRTCGLICNPKAQSKSNRCLEGKQPDLEQTWDTAHSPPGTITYAGISEGSPVLAPGLGPGPFTGA